jgi:hypothetical protein
MNHAAFVSLVSLFVVAGCDEAPAPVPVTTTSAALDARDVLARGGEFHFVLDESPGILASIQERCAKEADAEACVDRIREAGAREGWRIVPIDADHAKLQSFGSEEGKEEIFLEVPVALEPAAGNIVKVRPTAPLVGTRLPPAEKMANGIGIEVIDENTLGFVDGPRGRLLFRRTR